MTMAELTYIGAGCLLPMIYLCQIRRWLQDDAGLTSYSLRESAMQCVLRVLIMPFIWSVGNTTMTLVVCFDLLGRAVELVAFRPAGSECQ
jgi:hypothetical protein